MTFPFDLRSAHGRSAMPPAPDTGSASPPQRAAPPAVHGDRPVAAALRAPFLPAELAVRVTEHLASDKGAKDAARDILKLAALNIAPYAPLRRELDCLHARHQASKIGTLPVKDRLLAFERLATTHFSVRHRVHVLKNLIGSLRELPPEQRKQALHIIDIAIGVDHGGAATHPVASTPADIMLRQEIVADVTQCRAKALLSIPLAQRTAAFHDLVQTECAPEHRQRIFDSLINVSHCLPAQERTQAVATLVDAATTGLAPSAADALHTCRILHQARTLPLAPRLQRDQLFEQLAHAELPTADRARVMTTLIPHLHALPQGIDHALRLMTTAARSLDDPAMRADIDTRLRAVGRIPRDELERMHAAFRYLDQTPELAPEEISDHLFELAENGGGGNVFGLQSASFLLIADAVLLRSASMPPDQCAEALGELAKSPDAYPPDRKEKCRLGILLEHASAMDMHRPLILCSLAANIKEVPVAHRRGLFNALVTHGAAMNPQAKAEVFRSLGYGFPDLPPGFQADALYVIVQHLAEVGTDAPNEKRLALAELSDAVAQRLLFPRWSQWSRHSPEAVSQVLAQTALDHADRQLVLAALINHACKGLSEAEKESSLAPMPHAPAPFPGTSLDDWSTADTLEPTMGSAQKQRFLAPLVERLQQWPAPLRSVLTSIVLAQAESLEPTHRAHILAALAQQLETLPEAQRSGVAHAIVDQSATVAPTRRPRVLAPLAWKLGALPEESRARVFFDIMNRISALPSAEILSFLIFVELEVARSIPAHQRTGVVDALTALGDQLTPEHKDALLRRLDDWDSPALSPREAAASDSHHAAR